MRKNKIVLATESAMCVSINASQDKFTFGAKWSAQGESFYVECRFYPHVLGARVDYMPVLEVGKKYRITIEESK